MGKPLPSLSLPSDAGPSSSSSAPLLLDYDDPSSPKSSEALPAYDDPSYLGEEPPPFTKYSPSTHLLTNGKVVSHDSHLNTSPEALYQWIHDESNTPPRPLLHIEGTHKTRTTSSSSSSKTTSSTSTVTDFSLYFDLSTFLLPSVRVVSALPSTPRRRGTRTAHTSEPEAGGGRDIRGWCHDYTENPSSWKEFSLHKVMNGLDTGLLRLHVESIIRSTNYRGNVSVSFPVSSRSVVVTPDNLVCRLRYGWYRWVFYLSFLWVITWPILWLGTKRWDVVDAMFDVRPGAEKDWVDRWGWVVMRLVRQKRRCSLKDAFTPENLRWVETHELAVEAEREERRRRERADEW
ncbi:hypothetical protein K440DRAFT_76967 [Wilcoxina mikolae CBS 423.85]|nr:hypothetical protein K440DRAFT_76967 [Wilcoxina mikolae CBS 423.85]